MQDPELGNAMEKVQAPIAYQDAGEFREWWERDATMVAEAIRRIGKVAVK